MSPFVSAVALSLVSLHLDVAFDRTPLVDFLSTIYRPRPPFWHGSVSNVPIFVRAIHVLILLDDRVT